jgi:hypothetical protein
MAQRRAVRGVSDAARQIVSDDLKAYSRRETLAWIAGVSASLAVGCHSKSRDPGANPEAGPKGSSSTPNVAKRDLPQEPPRGDLADPDMQSPRTLWSLVLSQRELAVVALLADEILPAADQAPSASSLGVHQFVNEWVSAPFEPHMTDLKLLRTGVSKLTAPVGGQNVTTLPAADRAKLAAKLMSDNTPEGRMFRRLRELVVLGYFTAPEGIKLLGYVGNVALTSFEAPSKRLMEAAGLT